jgi:hypothetical protein
MPAGYVGHPEVDPNGVSGLHSDEIPAHRHGGEGMPEEGYQ